VLAGGSLRPHNSSLVPRNCFQKTDRYLLQPKRLTCYFFTKYNQIQVYKNLTVPTKLGCALFFAHFSHNRVPVSFLLRKFLVNLVNVFRRAMQLKLPAALRVHSGVPSPVQQA
jgi:hypothetical protein